MSSEAFNVLLIRRGEIDFDQFVFSLFVLYYFNELQLVIVKDRWKVHGIMSVPFES